MDLVDLPAKSRDTTILELRDFSRKLVRELGFMRTTLADSDLAPSAVHAIIEIGATPGISAKELGNILRLDKSNTSRQVAKLEAGGLVNRKVANEDARSSELYLTEAGQKLRRKIDRFATDQVSSALRRMVPADQQVLVRSLALYADALGFIWLRFVNRLPLSISATGRSQSPLAKAYIRSRLSSDRAATKPLFDNVGPPLHPL